MAPTLVLRTAWYASQDLSALKKGKTSDDSYHGGETQDEVTALLSLSIGRRLRAGGSIRTFEPEDTDPLGRPQADWGRSIAYHSSPHAPIIPVSFMAAQIAPHARFSKLPLLAVPAASALVKAARQYQEALWLSESEPNLSWLLFVTAIETAANCWQKDSGTPSERLNASHLGEKLTAFLEKYNASEGLSELAEIVVNVLGSTKKFCDFLIEHLPSPIEPRPEPAFQVSWKQVDLRKCLTQIYGYRSKALHEGKPFPAPLLNSAFKRESGVYMETPLGPASQQGSVWASKDLPMQLHVFHHIVQGALLKWWDNLPISYDLDSFV